MDNTDPGNPVEVNRITDPDHLATKKYVDDYVAANIEPIDPNNYVKKEMVFVNGDETSGIALGSRASGVDQSVAINDASITGADAVAIGVFCEAKSSTISIGQFAKARGSNSIVVGANPVSVADNSILIGYNTSEGTIATNSSIVIGNSSTSDALGQGNAILLGQNSRAANDSIVIGNNITSVKDDANSLAIGNSLMASITLGALTITIDSAHNRITFTTESDDGSSTSYVASTS
jgi:hypothetical protein